MQGSLRRCLPILAAVGAVALLASLWPCVISPKPVVTLDSLPRGASVFVNGRLAGATPLELAELPSGSYSLGIERDGYTRVQRNFVLGSGSVHISETLKAIPTESITVNVAPEGSEIVLDGESRGHTPMVLVNIPVGWHELEVRKPNFATYAKRIELEASRPLTFKLELDDKILDMLKRNIAKEPQSIRHYMDMALYLYKNRQTIESAQYFVKALGAAAATPKFGPDVSPAEQAAELEAHGKEREKLNFLINEKEQLPSKDRAEFTRIIESARETILASQFDNWGWVETQAHVYINNGKFDQAQQLLIKHIEAVKDRRKLEQAYIFLLDVQLQMKRIDLAHGTYTTFANAYSTRPELMRQAAHALYSKQGAFEEPERSDVLSMAEKLFRSAIATSRKYDPEMCAQCDFELGNVLVYQDRMELAVAAYQDSIDLTKSQAAKEDRMMRQVECLKKMRKYTEARKVLYLLSASQRPDIVAKAKQDLKTIELLDPSPDKDK